MCEGRWEKIEYSIIVGFKAEWSYATSQDDRDGAWKHLILRLWALLIK